MPPMWITTEGESRPVLTEVFEIYSVGLAALDAKRLYIPFTIRAARLLYRGPATDSQFTLVKALFDYLFLEGETWIAGEIERSALSTMFGHADLTFGMAFEERRYRTGRDFNGQAPDTFRRIDKNGKEPEYLRQIATAVESIIERLGNSALRSPALEPSSDLVRRTSYLDEIRELIDAGHIIIGIWGEPGTGKTTLASQVAFDLERGSVLTLRAGDLSMLKDDTVDALVVENQQPASWTESYCRGALKRIIGEGPQSGVVVIDNIDNEEFIWQLIPAKPKIPVIITSRKRLRNERIQAIELHDFTEAEASDFIQSRLSNCGKGDAKVLANILGLRPLALDHVTLFIQESPGIDPPDLIDKLATSIRALALATPPTNGALNLIQLYKMIYDSITRDETIKKVLDCFIGLAGSGGSTFFSLMYYFIGTEYGGNVDRVQLSSGLRTLAEYGLVRQSGLHLVMHPLTYGIMYELSIYTNLHYQGDYLLFLADPDATSINDESTTIENISEHARDLQKEAAACGLHLLPEWFLITCLDQHSWAALRIFRNEDGQTALYVARYEVHPQGIYKVDSRTARREPIELMEGRELHRVIHLYEGKARQHYLESQPGGQAPSDQASST